MSCHYCRGTGFLVAVHKTKKSIFSFRCNCLSSKWISDKMMEWSHHYEKEYEPDILRVTIEEKSRGYITPIKAPKIDYQAKQANDFDEEEIPF